MNEHLKKTWRILLFLFVVLLLPNVAASAAEPLVSALGVDGNDHVVAEHILGVVGTRVGEPLSREQLQSDVEAIYNLGFFSFVDINLQSIAGGIGVTYIVRENPVVEQITFSGNNIYKDEDLLKVVFTMPGTVFNRVFFRNDLDRIQEKYHKDGYVMVKIADVVVEGGLIDVKIVEPKVGNIIIQGNRKTKTKVIAREIKLKKGDPFNTTILRHSLNKLQNKGFFDDVSIGFEPGENEEETDIILTVSEQKTGRVGLSISHGTESGWSGGLAYTDSNWKGLGHIAEVGFEMGDNEQYWISYAEPYMDSQNFAWKIGFSKRKWEDRYYYRRGVKQLKYDDDVKNIYLGAGRKFGRDEKFSWFLTLDWKDVDAFNFRERIHPGIEDELTRGKIFALIGTVSRNNTDPYLSYSKGDIIDFNIEQALEALGGEYSYTKYWLQARYYTPVKGLGDLFDRQFGDEDNPAIFAARIRAGFSSGDVPTASLYSLGGSSTLRGYDSGYFLGSEMFLANFELRIPIEKAFSFVLFYDAGNAWKNPWDTNGGSFSLSDLHDSWGVGVRVKTPLGNFRLDHATGEDESRTHFSFGEMF
ncbi:Beta-barrel assembly machine subunit BamA [Aminivibrio pyruvatiphilus]|uniref:Beta-barrel assembly machine subunit BamA n=1 Tax=Aminivibrio pyruvatiphilus TaxID=1005740 RepID=A0A4R8MJ79_9BACT|nr:BamA/TamA family outer membrane protein [Aminivibrio pyruvatiphilus]TDY65088.1 Beta-barrel assembly machine subunit BamA [Aminivibrio pyruvatiphilus]